MSGGSWPEEPSPRFVLYRMLRYNELCPSPPECPEVLIADPLAGPDALPCSECPREKLHQYLVSPPGQGLLIAVDLDFALQARIHIGLDDISYLEFQLLRVLAEERDKYRIEQMKKR